MYKFIQVIEGKNEREFQVKAGTKLAIVLTAVHVGNAQVTLRVRLVGRGAAVTITGIIIGGGEEKVSLHTMQIHEAPETTSDLLIKTVLSDHAVCLYDGGIRVEKKAQKTDAYQRNENLLLSEKAYVESKPSLEILANDVRCTHGATVGSVDPEQVWYLATRGISGTQSEHLIAAGFIQSALDRVVDSDAKRKLEHQMSDAV
jgi:Fe-S cluster assembly protein SufD